MESTHVHYTDWMEIAGVMHMYVGETRAVWRAFPSVFVTFKTPPQLMNGIQRDAARMVVVYVLKTSLLQHGPMNVGHKTAGRK